MLKRQMPDRIRAAVGVRMADARLPAPFAGGLEYGAPARGMWNIVHTGMLIPGAHEIFVCAEGCLRGVVLTAAEMGAVERFSMISIRENNVLDGDMEELIIDGVTDILHKLPAMPPAVLLYTSCIHHFMACDLDRVYRTLRGRFPQVDFTDCYMNPIMRKSGLTPDQLMRRQLYSLLKKRPVNDKSVNLIGNDLPTDDTSELVRMIRENGFTLRDITACRTYGEYQLMAESFLSISTYPPARAGGDALEHRLGQRHLYLPWSADFDVIDQNLQKLAGVLGIPVPDTAAARRGALDALEQTRQLLNGKPVALDYTAVPRPMELARLLVRCGFNLTEIYIDAVSGEEESAARWLQSHAPELMLYPTSDPMMRVAPRQAAEPPLCIGQKAAYFTGSDAFVNIVEGGGLYGFDGIARLAGLMADAELNRKDPRGLITVKGLGCGCCGI